MTTTALIILASNYFWIWVAILVVVALVALFKVTPFNAAEPATNGGDEPEDKPPENDA